MSAIVLAAALASGLVLHNSPLAAPVQHHNPATARLLQQQSPTTPAARSLRSGPLVCTEEKGNGGLRILEWIPSQQLLVASARFFWNTLWYIMLSELAPQSATGAYVRPAPQLGSAAVTGWPAELPAVSGRYHVYIGNACPWCHRVGATLALRGLVGKVGVTRMADDPQRASRGGWAFDDADPDPLCGASDLREV